MRRFAIHQGMLAKKGSVVSNHFCPAMPNARRSCDRGVSDRERASGIAGIPLGEGHHRPIRHLDAAESMLFGQFDALAEPGVCTDHPSANVFGITEAAERHGFHLGRPGTSGQLQCDPVFSQAALDVASRKT